MVLPKKVVFLQKISGWAEIIIRDQMLSEKCNQLNETTLTEGLSNVLEPI